jgi:hypothetical protein
VWAAHDPGAERTEAMLRHEHRALGRRSSVEALRLFRNPHQNVVFAGHRRRLRLLDGGTDARCGSATVRPLLPVPGWTDASTIGSGDLPFEEHPHVLEAGARLRRHRQQPALAAARSRP